MSVSLLWGVGDPPAQRFDDLLGAAREAALTYDHVGSTLDPSAAARRRRLSVGTGESAFAASADRLSHWALHDAVGATVLPPDAPIEVGVTVLVVLRAGPVWVGAPNRIVAVVDDESRFGFAYGSLPGHPFTGEESFAVERRSDGVVEGVVAVDAEPATPLTRALGPVLRVVQRVAVGRYLDALRP